MKLKIVTFIAAALLLSGCASDKEPSTSDSSTSGSGTTAAPGSVEDFQVNVGDRVFFDYDSYEIRADAQDTLNRQAAWLGQYGNYAITVEGHCDERGTREYNLALGERRANAVRNYLVAQGVDPNRIQTISYGKERPEIADSNEFGLGAESPRRDGPAVKLDPRDTELGLAGAGSQKGAGARRLLGLASTGISGKAPYLPIGPRSCPVRATISPPSSGNGFITGTAFRRNFGGLSRFL